jgi:hypothetical protein
MRAPAALCCPPIGVLRGACTVTTPVRPAAAAHCIRWSVVGCVVVRRAWYVALIVAPLLPPNTPTTAGHPSAVAGLAGCCSSHAFHSAPAPCEPSLTHRHKPSYRMAHVASVRVVLRRFASSPCLPSRAVSVRVACSLRCALHVASPRVACCALHVASLHASSALVTSAHCMLHRFIVSSETRSPRYGAPPCGTCGVLCVRGSIGQRPGCCGGRAAARCARAQRSGGGVLSMAKGTALFDTVAISGTEAGVRAGWCGDAQLGRVSADGCEGRLQWAFRRRLLRRTKAAW